MKGVLLHCSRYQIVEFFKIRLGKLGLHVKTRVYTTHSFGVIAAASAWASKINQQFIAIIIKS